VPLGITSPIISSRKSLESCSDGLPPRLSSAILIFAMSGSFDGASSTVSGMLFFFSVSCAISTSSCERRFASSSFVISPSVRIKISLFILSCKAVICLSIATELSTFSTGLSAT